MGRKIPAKKHRGVKDPLEQQARRLQSVQKKINAPPRDPDEQPVPRSLWRLFGQKPTPNTTSSSDRRKASAKHHKPQAKDAKARGPAGVRSLKRVAGEGARAFSRRITSAVQALHDDELHYPNAFDDDDDEPEGRGERRRRRRGGDGVAGAEGERVSRKQRRRQRIKEERKEKQNARQTEASEVRFERVPFGARADAPPALTAPRRAKAHAAPRPGQRSLLLTSLLRPPSAPASAPSRPSDARASAASELRRLDVVAAYRAVKAARRKPQAVAPVAVAAPNL